LEVTSQSRAVPDRKVHQDQSQLGLMSGRACLKGVLLSLKQDHLRTEAMVATWICLVVLEHLVFLMADL
jgi:hypothetical protein